VLGWQQIRNVQMNEERSNNVDRLIREVLPRRLRNAVLTQGQSLHADLGIDSLGLMSLAFRIEEEFAIDLMEHAQRVTAVDTVGDLLQLVAELGRREGEATIAAES
jgi:acyl carrier protein